MPGHEYGAEYTRTQCGDWRLCIAVVALHGLNVTAVSGSYLPDRLLIADDGRVQTGQVQSEGAFGGSSVLRHEECYGVFLVLESMPEDRNPSGGRWGPLRPQTSMLSTSWYSRS